jgi:hypothetical protein
LGWGWRKTCPSVCLSHTEKAHPECVTHTQTEALRDKVYSYGLFILREMRVVSWKS